MDSWGWDEKQRGDFLRLQYTAQRSHYAARFPEAEHRIILCEGLPAGRILIDESATEFCLADIVLLPDHRGAGVGTSLIRDLLARATTARKTVVLSVAKHNPAISLYQRLGFRVTGDRVM